MQQFHKAVYNKEHIDNLKKLLMEKFNYSDEKAELNVREHLKGDLYKNDTYTVLAREMEYKDNPTMIWLSIKRNDREVIHDWRDMQKIKNMLVGEENEGLEIYPPESNLMDNANQYHLWVFKNKDVRVPFGFHETRSLSEDEFLDSKQRKF